MGRLATLAAWALAAAAATASTGTPGAALVPETEENVGHSTPEPHFEGEVQATADAQFPEEEDASPQRFAETQAKCDACKGKTNDHYCLKEFMGNWKCEPKVSKGRDCTYFDSTNSGASYKCQAGLICVDRSDSGNKDDKGLFSCWDATHPVGVMFETNFYRDGSMPSRLWKKLTTLENDCGNTKLTNTKLTEKEGSCTCSRFSDAYGRWGDSENAEALCDKHWPMCSFQWDGVCLKKGAPRPTRAPTHAPREDTESEGYKIRTGYYGRE